MGSRVDKDQMTYVNEKALGVPFIENKYWKMVREGLNKSLTDAFSQGQVDCYQQIVQPSKHTIVQEAIVLDRRELFKLCEVYGADWNHKDPNGVTPLMKAAALNRTYYVQRLIELQADQETKDNKGRTAYDYAKMYSKVQSMDLLAGDTEMNRQN